MHPERFREREPFRRAQPVCGELPVTTLLHHSAPPLERDNLIVWQLGDALTRATTGADLDPIAKTQVLLRWSESLSAPCTAPPKWSAAIAREGFRVNAVNPGTADTP
jgi:hypothetical protein